MDAPGDVPLWRSTITGRVDVTHLSRAGQRRAVRIYLPPDYESTDQDYPVLYMFDGQNLFDRATSAFGMEWRVDETIEALVADGAFRGAVVVGVDSPSTAKGRYAEYTAWDWMLAGEPVNADGAATAQFLVADVIPHVQASYRVARDRGRVGLAGSSLGGYMTLHVGVAHPELFGRLLAFSPVALDEPMAGHRLHDQIVHTGFAPGTWVYLDMGDAEALDHIDHPDQLVENLAATRAAVANSVVPPRQLVSRVIADATHDEDAWAARFGEVLLWAFAGAPDPR